MILKIFAIRDTKGEHYGSPFFQKSNSEAERSFHQLVNDPASMPSKYPEDFDLYALGEYDDLTGKIKALDTPYHIIKATGLKNA